MLWAGEWSRWLSRLGMETGFAVAGQILTPTPPLQWVAWICDMDLSSRITGTDLSSPTELVGVLLGVRGKVFPYFYPEFPSSWQLPGITCRALAMGSPQSWCHHCFPVLPTWHLMSIPWYPKNVHTV